MGVKVGRGEGKRKAEIRAREGRREEGGKERNGSGPNQLVRRKSTSMGYSPKMTAKYGCGVGEPIGL